MYCNFLQHSELKNCKQMRKLIIAIALLTELSGFGQNQFHIGQYAIHQPFLNPASIGTFQEINMALVYKNQWIGFDGAPHLGGINYNMPIGKHRNTL
jgi:hypothetical protein